MSQAPQDAREETGKEDYLAAFEELAIMIRNGASFSGRERHCVFSNRGDGSFTDVSGLSGFGLPEDGRGMALSDWDHDGDIDVWVSNRTSPRLRFFQNKIPGEKAEWVSFRLEGNPDQQVPRDAVGARVILEMKDGSLRSKTLHAGEGFVSQSSKWLHFGLGEGAELASVRVHWKGRDNEEFSGVEPNGRWHLKHGTGAAVASEPRESVVLDEGGLEGLVETGVARMGWSLPLKVPQLVYQDFEGNDHDLSELAAKGIIFVNLWATWCEPCADELKLLEEAKDRLEQKGVEVIALNVDHLGDEGEETRDPVTMLKELGYQGRAGTASPELVDLLDRSITKTFFIHRGMPVPTSFLIDRGGWLSMAYKGPVDLEVLLEDVETLGKGPEISREAAMPFPGQWADRALATSPVKNAMTYMEGQYYDDARAVLREFLEEQGSPPVKAVDTQSHTKNMQQAEVYFLLGEIDRLSEAMTGAISNYEKSLQYNQKQVMVLNRLAWLLATNGDPGVRNGKRAVSVSEFMMQAPKVAQNPGLLGTVAASYAAAGDFPKAVATTRKAIVLLEVAGDAKSVEVQKKRLKLYEAKEILTE